ncbi:hypothetical protein BFJ63_vAg20343 [Fusarium oxysporum f. sp. narcissi]|uniref:Uncharacterized protein n=1 Tax=Fusarium oxysporum f. sp. narcissi TaxID=451672 RepID=A0A4Q2UTG7_FUSOX|nr:hypothetical protein BFJ63_vAg20343 [Fusarium oxysporum f. sp. narcissi]
MTRSLCTLPRRVNFAVNKTWHQRQDVRLATTLYTGEPFAGDFDTLHHATFSLCVLATVSTKDCGQAARGGFAKPIGSPQRVNQAPATIARSISSPMQPPNDHGLTRA